MNFAAYGWLNVAWWLGWRFGATLIGIGLILKLLGMESGQLTILYYLVFPLGFIIWAIWLARKQGVRRGYFRRVGIGTVASLTASAIYSVWVIVNTRFFIGGPIPALREAVEEVRLRQAAGETVHSAAVLERSAESPEVFALLVIAQLTVWGIFWILLAAALPLIFGKRPQHTV